MADFKYAGFSGPHPSLVVECPTCGSPAMHYCNTGIDGGAGDRPHDARRIAAGTMPEPPDQTAGHDGLGVAVRFDGVTGMYVPAAWSEPTHRALPTDAEALAEIRHAVWREIVNNQFDAGMAADAVLKALGLANA